MLNFFRNFDLLTMAFRIPAILIAMTVHEFFHGFSAYKLGDSTAKHDGRLSLNPAKHIDPIGFILIVIFGFGWAKPVMFNPNYFKHGKSDIAVTAFAGPLSNIVLAFIFMLVLYPVDYYFGNFEAGYYITAFLFINVWINVLLGVFNMIPVPPLDGSKVFFSILPDEIYSKVLYADRMGMIFIAIIIFSGIFDNFLGAAIESIIMAFNILVSHIYFFL